MRPSYPPLTAPSSTPAGRASGPLDSTAKVTRRLGGTGSGVVVAVAGPLKWAMEGATMACAALLLAAIAPLGLASGETADQVAAAFGIRRPFVTATPLADVLVKFFTLLPLAEAGTRAHGLAAVAGLTAVVLLVTRGRHLSSPSPSPSQSPSPTQAPALDWSVLAGVALLIFSRPFLETATIRPAAAVDLCLFVAITVCLESVRRDSRRSAAGLALAFLCGLAAGASWPVRAATWPLAVIMTAGAVRRGERWPLLAPTLFVCGGGVILAGAVNTDTGIAAATSVLLRGLVLPGSAMPAAIFNAAHATGGREIVGWVIDDAGVLGLLVAALGWGRLFWRSPAQAILLFLPPALAVAAALWTGNIFAARLFTVAGLVAPVAAAVDFIAAWFGRARHAATLVLVVIIALPPALVGIGQAMDRAERRHPAAVARHLDSAFSTRSHAAWSSAAPSISTSTLLGPPADEQTARWWRYGRAVGLR